jgi:hypothetical protein
VHEEWQELAIMSDKLRGPNSSLWTTEEKESGRRRAVLFLAQSERQELLSDVPWSLVSFSSPHSPIRELS